MPDLRAPTLIPRAIRFKGKPYDLAGKIGFVLAFAVVHELPDAHGFFTEVAQALAPSGRVLLAEPRGHVSQEEFEKTLEAAAAKGLRTLHQPAMPHSRTALLARE